MVHVVLYRLPPQDRAKTLRQSVDVTRLSRIALSNLDKEGDGSDYAGAEARHGDIRIENADAELDFEEQREESGFWGRCKAVHAASRGGWAELTHGSMGCTSVTCKCSSEHT